MASVTFKGESIHTIGIIPQTGQKAPGFTLVGQDLKEASLSDFKGQKKILNIFLSVDTSVCAASIKKFHASSLSNTVILNISKDLPFAQKRFCGAEGIENARTLSAFRGSFSKDYNLEIMDSPLKGLCSRVVIVLDENDTVLYSEQVPEITQEPNYQKAIEAMKAKTA